MKPTVSDNNTPLGIAVADDGISVILQFDQKILWCALTPEAAQEIAGVLVERAKKCKDYKPLVIKPV